MSGFSSGVPAGWSIQFKNQSGGVITSTPSIPGGSVYAFKAEVTASSTPAQAQSDQEYFIAFAVNSNANPASAPFVDPTTGVADVKIERVLINPSCSVSLAPNGSEQIQAGGIRDFAHTLANNGNSTQSFDLRTFVGADDAGADDDSWTSNIYVDTTGDDMPDTILTPTTTGICY